METGEEEGIIVVEVEARPDPDEAAVKTMVKTVARTPRGRSTAQFRTLKPTKCAAAITPTVTKLGTV